MSAARVTFALIFVALGSFAIGIGVALVLSAENVASQPIPGTLHEPARILPFAPGAPVFGPVPGPAVPIGQLTHSETEELPAAPLPKPAEPGGPLPETSPPTTSPAAQPAAGHSPCYHVPCRRGLFRRR